MQGQASRADFEAQLAGIYYVVENNKTPSRNLNFFI